MEKTRPRSFWKTGVSWIFWARVSPMVKVARPADRRVRGGS